MAKHPAKCPRCGNRLEFDTAVDEQLQCPGCQVLLTFPGKFKPSDKVDPLLGQTLGEFEIIELLGRGGMGAVYKARQPSLDRFVAVKVLPRNLLRDASFVERFQREARAAAAVNHPNIIQVYAVGQDKGFQYIAMELVDGESLADFLQRNGPLPADLALDLFKQVTAALAKAHAAGIVHRDLKPGNILLTADGLPKIADFGLAKRTGTDLTVTQTGVAMGTPLYFPPEGARGQRFDARSDLYSLGATFYHLLAGTPPFEGANAIELAMKHAEQAVPPLDRLAPATPAALCEIIHRLLRKKGEERFPSAADLLDALSRVPAGAPSLARDIEGMPTLRMPTALRPSPAEFGAPSGSSHPHRGPSRWGGEHPDAGALRGQATRTLAPGARPRPAGPPQTRRRRPGTVTLLLGGGLLGALVLGLVLGAFSHRVQPSSGLPGAPSSSPANTGSPSVTFEKQGQPSSATPSVAEKSPGITPQPPPKPPAWEAAWVETDARAKALAQEQHYAKAIAQYEALLRRFDDPELRRNAGRVVAEFRQQAEAVPLAKWRELKARADQLAAGGDFEQATRLLQSAQGLALADIADRIAAATEDVAAARRAATEQAAAAYAPHSDRVWALFKTRQHPEADKLIQELAARPEFRFVADRVQADAEASALLKDLWKAAEAGLAATRAKFIVIAGAGGTLEELKDGVVTIKKADGTSETRAVTQLATKQAIYYAGLKDKADARSMRMLGVFLLADGTAPTEARDALAAVGDEPAVAFYQERLAIATLGAAEARAQRAWLLIEAEARSKLDPARAKRLTHLLADFEKKHGQAKLHGGLAKDLAALKTRIEDSLGYTEWPFDEAEAKRRQEETAKALGVKVEQDIDLGGGVKMAFVLIPAGEFLMGSPPTKSPDNLAAAYGGDPREYEGEFPQHRVKISRPFWLGKYEVTQEQWMAVFQTNPSANKGKPENPVELLDWNQAHGFAKALSEKLGKTIRLPTEAEWEYACRAGTASEYYFGNDVAKMADFGWGGGATPAPVGLKKPNAWGFYDMAGNVWEWCEDWYAPYEKGAQTDPKGPPAGGRRVLRGGSWNSTPGRRRSAYRRPLDPGDRGSSLGFRVLLVSQGAPVPTPAPPPQPLAAGPWKVYTAWPFDAAEAVGRQKATAKALGVKVEQEIDVGGGAKMAFVLIPAGEFLMGSPPATSPEQLTRAWGYNPDVYTPEFPQRRVTISRPFCLGKFEVTQEQWQAVMGDNPSRFNSTFAIMRVAGWRYTLSARAAGTGR